MLTIKPSEGRRYARQRVFIEGLIAGQKSYSSQFGGRWVVDVTDVDGSLSEIAGTLVLNEQPKENSAISALGVTEPNRALVALFSGDEFSKLYQPGRRFRAEVIIGVHEANVWFNVSQLLLFEPSFSIGVRQVFREPFCERRLFLRSRGIKGNSYQKPTGLGGIFIGNLVHSMFQDFACTSNRSQFADDFLKNPKEFLLRHLQSDALLLGAFGKLGDIPCISGDEWTTAKNQVANLIQSPKVLQLLESETQWFSEVPLGTTAIDGDTDLRSSSKIVELKTGDHKQSHDDQVYMYLIAEMLQHGHSIASAREAILVSSSSRIHDDKLRVMPIGDSSQLQRTLERFLLARHRLLLVSSGLRLPKIDFEPRSCEAEACEYYFSRDERGNIPGTSACHFYCQTDRSWSCTGCRHSTCCTEHSKYHSFQVLDEANKIRKGLAAEIEQRRRESNIVVNWQAQFQVLGATGRRQVTLKPDSNPIIDPPFPGERVHIRVDESEFSTWGQLSSIYDTDEWSIVNRGGELPVGATVQVGSSRSTLTGVYFLLSCLDELQRLNDVSDRDGIAFAGGNVPAKRPELAPSLDNAIQDASVTDIFCQSFSVKTALAILERSLQLIQGNVLIVSNSRRVPQHQHIDLRGDQLLRIAMKTNGITSALSKIKDELEETKCWVMSPSQLLDSDIVKALPGQGQKFFDFAVICEESGITGLEYFCIRKFAQRMITIGDANSVGHPIRSSHCKIMGLGDNLLARVFGRGFPYVEKKISARLVCGEGEEIDTKIRLGLDACRLHTVDRHSNLKVFEFTTYSPGQMLSEDQLICAHAMTGMPGIQPKVLRLRVDDVVAEDELYADVRLIEQHVNSTLVRGDVLISPISGRHFTVVSPPANRTNGEENWLIEVTAPSLCESVIDDEAQVTAGKVRQLLDMGVRPKNLVVMSPFRTQLEKISRLFDNLINKDISFRTPYGIRSESWGHVIISCGTANPQSIDARELYTMMRSAITHVHLIGTQLLISNHPMLRNMSINAQTIPVTDP